MKYTKILFAIALTFAVLLDMIPLESQAAGKLWLNKTSTSVYVGKTVTLKVMGTGQKVRWSSSDKKVVRVSSRGRVTGKKAGKAVISARVSGKKYTCKVMVKKPYLSNTKKTLALGDDFTLKMKGSSVIKWKSSNQKVATVSSKGKVKTKAIGSATITCKCKNGKSYKCKIIVKTTVNNANTRNENENLKIADDGHIHKYEKLRDVKDASDTGFGEIEYICKVKGCGKTIVMPYGKAVQYVCKDPDTGNVTQTATRYGYWDTKSAKDILEGINEYRREKGLSDLKYQDKYQPYMREHVMSCYFNICNFNITPEDKVVRSIYERISADCHDKTFFKTQPALLLPGNDGISTAQLYERDDMDVGVGCFTWTCYYSPAENKSQPYYSETYCQPVTHYDVVICIFANKQG